MPAHVTSTEALHARSNGSGAVSIIASAGGIPALIEILRGIPLTFAMPILIAQHLSRSAPSVLPTVLSWHAGCAAKWAEHDEEPEAGIAYVVPPRSSLEICRGRFVVTRLPDDARSWLRVPDLLMCSLAEWFGSDAITVILSGMLPAGLGGLRAIRRSGGITMAQDKSSSSHFDMPMAAADLGKADIIFSPRQIAQALNVLSEQRLICSKPSDFASMANRPTAG